MKHKGYSGQSQLLIPLIIILTSVAAFAANTTINAINSTSNGSNSTPTGDFIGIPQTMEKSFPIEVWADTSINLEIGENLVRATLFLDNGDLLENQQIDFYLNNTILGSGLTNSDGFVDFPVSEKEVVKAVFNGDSSLFFNPSETEIDMLISREQEISENKTENLTIEIDTVQGKAEIGKPVKWKKIVKISNPNDFDVLDQKISINVPEKSEKILTRGKNKNPEFEIKNGSKIVELKIDKIEEKIKEEYVIEYETPAPEKEENITDKGKIVTVKSDADVHYSNVFVETDVEETHKGSIKIHWLVNGSKIDVTNNPLFNFSFVDLDENGLIEKIQWVVPYLSEQTFEVTITVLNLYTFLRDGENWIVAFNTSGTANLTINSTNAGWTEFLTDNSSTFDEMRFLDIKCGDNSLKDLLQLIDEFGNIYNYSDLTENDSIDIKHLFIQDYSCNETGYLSNNMLKSGYAKLQFTFGGQIAFAYDADLCAWKTDEVVYAEVGTTGSAVISYDWWEPDYNCSDAGGPLNGAGCYINNITARIFSSTTFAGDVDTYFGIMNDTSGGTYYYPTSFNYTGAGTFGPMTSCGNSNNASTDTNSPITCNLNYSDGFNKTNYTIVILGTRRGATAISEINYQWCWPDYFPHLENPKVNGTQSGFSAGWGSVFNFSVEIWDPTRNKTNVSLWYRPTAGSSWMYAYSRNITLPSSSSPGNLTNFTLNFSCNDGNLIDDLSNDLGVLGAAKYYKFHAKNEVGFENDTYDDSYGDIYFTPLKDNLTLYNATPNNSVVNRTGQSINLSQRIQDNTRSVYLGENEVSGGLYVQRDGTSFNYYGISGTNSTGHLYYSLTPTCSDNFEPGPQLWYITASSTSCYNSNESANLTLIIYGNLSASVVQPTGNPQYDRGDSITIKAYIENDCGNGQTGFEDKVNFTLMTGASTYYCNPISEELGETGNYSCDWDSIAGVAGTYNITVNTSDGYYYNSTV
ncbi:MAG: hypothetical protein ACFFDS_07645, partial [Candidatus Thorarchaeota archaeon]